MTTAKIHSSVLSFCFGCLAATCVIILLVLSKLCIQCPTTYRCSHGNNSAIRAVTKMIKHWDIYVALIEKELWYIEWVTYSFDFFAACGPDVILRSSASVFRFFLRGSIKLKVGETAYFKISNEFDRLPDALSEAFLKAIKTDNFSITSVIVLSRKIRHYNIMSTQTIAH